MRISYLPEIVSGTGDTVFPISTSGVSKKVRLSTLNNFSGAGTISKVQAGNNIKTSGSGITSTGTVNFYFPGSIYVFPGSTIPDGWLSCDGQAVSRSLYADLFSVLGTYYGSGDGRTTFNLPDMRGRSIAGVETMGGVGSSLRLVNSRPGNVNPLVIGSTGGQEAYTLSGQEVGLQPHTHTHSLSTSWGGDYEQGNKCNGGDGDTSGRWPSGSTLGSQLTLTWNYTFTNNATSDLTSASHPNLPPLVFLKWVIKY